MQLYLFNIAFYPNPGQKARIIGKNTRKNAKKVVSKSMRQPFHSLLQREHAGHQYVLQQIDGIILVYSAAAVKVRIRGQREHTRHQHMLQKVDGIVLVDNTVAVHISLQLGHDRSVLGDTAAGADPIHIAVTGGRQHLMTAMYSSQSGQ